MTPEREEALRRQRNAASPKASAWVSASAGTGKTKVLVDRILRLLLDGTRPERILAITFTRAAAAEMENRLFARLSDWAASDDLELARELCLLTGSEPDPDRIGTARTLLARTLDCPGGMRIQTIHSFCQILLTRFPLEAGLAPHFRVLDEIEARTLRREARSGMLRAASADRGARGDALASVARNLDQRLAHKALDELGHDPSGLTDSVKRAGGLDAYLECVAEAFGVETTDTENSILEVAAGAFDEPALARAARVLEKGTPSFADRGRTIQRWLAGDPRRRVGSWDEWREAFLTRAGQVRRHLAPTRADGSVQDTLQSAALHVRQAEQTLAGLRNVRITSALVRLAHDESRRYRRLKRQRAALDYADLIRHARRLLNGRIASEWILYKLDGGIDHVLIDEAQDTSSLQWDVIESLAREFFAGQGGHDRVRTLFAVGDPKQSIFRFQGAEPRAFEAMRERFGQRARDARLDWRPVALGLSFRSGPAVLAAVDAFARDHPAGLGSGPVTHVPDRSQARSRVEVWPAIQPPEGASLPDSPLRTLAERITGRIGSLMEREGRSPGDFMVLLRKRQPFMPYIARALRQGRIPATGLDRMPLAEEAGVVDAMQLARFLLLPDDDLALANVLRGPFTGVEGGLSDEELFELAHARKGTLWQALQARVGESASCARAAGRLSGLLRRSERESPYEFFSGVLDGPDPARPELLARLGADAADSMDEFLTQAIEYGRREVPSLEGFLDWLQREPVEIKRDMEPRGQRVRLMTVHAAKGLEAPVVFLADAAAEPRFSSTFVWTDRGVALRKDPQCERIRNWIDGHDRRDQEEYRRLLYVAMTRAQDQLIVASWKGRSGGGTGHWFRWIRKGLEGLPDTKRLTDEDPAHILERGHQTRDPSPATATPVPDLPSWFREPCPPEAGPRPHRQPSRSDGHVGNRLAVVRGELAHRLLQSLAGVPESERPARGRSLVRRRGRLLPESARGEILDRVLRILANPAFRPLFGPEGRAEVPLAGSVNGAVVSGTIDRLVVSAERALAVEFKTGRVPATWDGVPPYHKAQLGDYVALLRDVYPDRRVEGALLYLDGPRLLSENGTLMSRPAPQPRRG